MRIAIISDIHGNFPALKVVKEKIEEYSPDKLICLGDIVGYYPWPVECIRYVMKNCDVGILGNHDQVVVAADFENKVQWFNDIAAAALNWCRKELLKPKCSKEASFLENLPLIVETDFNDTRVLFTHGSPDDPWEYIIYHPLHADRHLEARMRRWLKNRKKDLIAIGHTHVPFIFRRKKAYVLNPGSVGQPRDGFPDASFAIVDINGGKLKIDIHRENYDIKETCEGIKRVDLPDFLCKRLWKGH
ncbi:MAG: metallophosphoesterase family protein [Candidatus Hodarchaeales archaeon]|jgi:predicted phosphodiesterase